MTGEILTTKQVTERYPFLPEATLRYLRHKNEGPESFKVGRRVLYKASAVEEWIADQAKETTRGGVQ